MQIKVIAAPQGFAPKEFREAWVGSILPVGVVFILPQFFLPYLVREIVSIEQARKYFLARALPEDFPAFVVPFIPAMQIIRAKRPEVADWWEEFHF